MKATLLKFSQTDRTCLACLLLRVASLVVLAAPSTTHAQQAALGPDAQAKREALIRQSLQQPVTDGQSGWHTLTPPGVANVEAAQARKEAEQAAIANARAQGKDLDLTGRVTKEEQSILDMIPDPD